MYVLHTPSMNLCWITKILKQVETPRECRTLWKRPIIPINIFWLWGCLNYAFHFQTLNYNLKVLCGFIIFIEYFIYYFISLKSIFQIGCTIVSRPFVLLWTTSVTFFNISSSYMYRFISVFCFPVSLICMLIIVSILSTYNVLKSGSVCPPTLFLS